MPLSLASTKRVSSRSASGGKGNSLPAGDNLVDEVVQRLRDHILTGELEAEAPLPSEGNLAETFRVSRTVIREAMRILRTQGLVEISRGRRPRVKKVGPQAAIESLDALLSRSPGSLAYLTQVRRPLEIEIAGLACQHATQEHWNLLEQANEELAAAGNFEECVVADVRFHRILAEATGNPLFVLLMETIAQLLYESRRRTISQSGVALALEEHRRILLTIRSRDPLAARAAMERHMNLIQRDLHEAGLTPQSSHQ